MATDFTGAKLALIHTDRLLVYRRDDRPDLPFPDYWDLPGGGREGDETPEDCAIRETWEEFGLTLGAGDLIWRRQYPSSTHPDRNAWFFVARLGPRVIGRISFGDEGQYWRLMRIAEFLKNERTPAFLAQRVADYLMSEQGAVA